MRWFEHKYTKYYSKGIHCKKVIYLQKSDFFFFTNRCKNRNCPLLKNSTFQPSTIIIIHWIACIKGRFLFSSKWIFIISSSLCPWIFWKVFGHSHRKAGFWPVIKMKPPETGALSLGPDPNSPFCVVQSSLSDSVSYCAESRGAGSRSQIRVCWWGAGWFTAEGAHAIGVGGVLLSIRMVRGL